MTRDMISWTRAGLVTASARAHMSSAAELLRIIMRRPGWGPGRTVMRPYFSPAPCVAAMR